ncbi:MAG: ABC transporter ATP-binding protein [Cyanobacteriota bacterium]|nr:ABC transporter ATP-binding protein [Cyanobacteriota bacterium]
MPASTSGSELPLVVAGVDFGWTPERPMLRGCSLEISRPGLWMLVGSNGSGKSTLLRLIAGLLSPERGCITTALRPALVFQNPDHQLLMPTCGTDLRLGLPLALNHRQAADRVEALLQQVGLQGMAHRPIHTLSGGQKQRLAIAGALAAEATLLLLDEPTALLDPDSQADVLALIRSLCDRQPNPLTALWVTHRLEELAHADGAARMERGCVGPWHDGAELARSFSLLPTGRGGG